MPNAIAVGDVGGGSSDDWAAYLRPHPTADSGVSDVEDKDERRDSAECLSTSLKAGSD